VWAVISAKKSVAMKGLAETSVKTKIWTKIETGLEQLRSKLKRKSKIPAVAPAPAATALPSSTLSQDPNTGPIFSDSKESRSEEKSDPLFPPLAAIGQYRSGRRTKTASRKSELEDNRTPSQHDQLRGSETPSPASQHDQPRGSETPSPASQHDKPRGSETPSQHDKPRGSKISLPAPQQGERWASWAFHAKSED